MRKIKRNIPQMVEKGLARAASKMKNTVTAVGSTDAFGAAPNSLTDEELMDKYRSYARQDQSKFRHLRDLYQRSIRLVGLSRANKILGIASDKRITKMVKNGIWKPPHIAPLKEKAMSPQRKLVYKRVRAEFKPEYIK